MAGGIPLRPDFTPSELRGLARALSDPKPARRLLALSLTAVLALQRKPIFERNPINQHHRSVVGSCPFGIRGVSFSSTTPSALRFPSSEAFLIAWLAHPLNSSSNQSISLSI